MIHLLAFSARRRVALWLCPELHAPRAETGLPEALIFPGNWRPRWWRNDALRDLLTLSHRRMTLEQVRDEAIRRGLTDVPSISAIQRYWARLDKVKAAQGPAFTSFPTQMEAQDG